jgi:hypothetical protein
MLWKIQLKHVEWTHQTITHQDTICADTGSVPVAVISPGPIPGRNWCFHSFVDICPFEDHLLDFHFPFRGPGGSLVFRRSPVSASACGIDHAKGDLQESTMFGDTTMSS